MEQSEAAAKADAQRAAQQDSPSAGNTSAPTPASSSGTQTSKSHKSAAAHDNPFPEAQSQAAAKADQANGKNSGSTQAGSSSSAGGYSSSDVHLPPPELGQGKFRPNQKMDTFTRDQTQDGRVMDDLNVADLYMKNGNYRGALLRYQDALQYDPQDDTALYGLADALCKANQTGSAMAHFKSYVKNNPQGKYARKADHMLAHPEKCMRNR